MKYFEDLFTLKLLRRLHAPTSANENLVHTAAVGNRLLHNYAPKDYAVTPLGQGYTKRPFFAIEKLVDNENIVKHGFVEIKSAGAGSRESHEGMLDTIGNYINELGLENYGCIFAMVIRGAAIGFYIYSNTYYLSYYNIPNYHNFVPMAYKMNKYQWAAIVKRNPNDFTGYSEYENQRENMIYMPEILEQVGVSKTLNLDYPHVYDLTNKSHQANIHDLFVLFYNNETQ